MNLKLFFMLTCIMLPSCWRIQKRYYLPEISETIYTIRPMLKQQHAYLAVDLVIHLQHPNQNIITIALPSKKGPVSDLYKEIQDLTALTPGLRIQGTDEPYIKNLINNAGHQTLRLCYRVVPTLTDFEHIDRQEHFYRPLITHTYFHLFGEGLFVYPATLSERPGKITLMWQDIPRHWHLANSHGVDQLHQTFVLDNHRFNLAIYVGGDFKLYKTQCNKNPVYLAMRGSFKHLKPKKLIKTIQRIVQTERDFWHDHHYPFYLVTIIPVGNTTATGGSGAYNALTLFLGNNQKLNARLIHLIAHEYFHQWNGRLIKRQEPEELVYWFAEGFTDYYASLLALRAGLIDLPTYLDTYNKTLYEYYLSPVKNIRNATILSQFWNDYTVYKIPYQRGRILAHNWNASIKQASSNTASLDDVMHAILREASTHKRVISADLFHQASLHYLANGTAPDIKRFIDDGQTIQPHPNALGPCCMLLWTKKLLFDVPFYQLNTQAYQRDKGACMAWFKN